MSKGTVLLHISNTTLNDTNNFPILPEIPIAQETNDDGMFDLFLFYAILSIIILYFIIYCTHVFYIIFALKIDLF